mmetsp:Transcript_5541/g.6221  ORF Transcript_5541/g.6221 Transcript_5541/m.6221 type:complete len:386 (+) Transcript_5541:237-1394(+)
MMWRKLILHCLISISILSIQTLHTSASKHQKHHVNKTNTDTKFDSAKLYDDKPTMEDIELYLKSIGIKNNDFCEYQRRIQQGEQQQQREEEEKEEGGISSDASEKKTPASESDGTYAMAWPAGIHLSKFISSPSFDKWSTKKKNVVEIGSGSGLVGIAFAANASMKVFKRKSDAKKIQLILTDMPTALPLIEHNINNNSGKISSIVQENIKVKPLVWGETKSLDDVISSFDSKKKIDLVLASDILYNTSKEIYQSLCKTISALLITKRCGDSSEEGEIILALRWRKPEEERYFFLEMQKTYQVDFELVLDGIKEGYDCNLDWKEFGNPLSEKSNMYFTNTFVNVEGESKALKDISETDMENMSDDEHDSFEARFIQIYCGRLRSA